MPSKYEEVPPGGRGQRFALRACSAVLLPVPTSEEGGAAAPVLRTRSRTTTGYFFTTARPLGLAPSIAHGADDGLVLRIRPAHAAVWVGESEGERPPPPSSPASWVALPPAFDLTHAARGRCPGIMQLCWSRAGRRRSTRREQYRRRHCRKHQPRRSLPSVFFFPGGCVGLGTSLQHVECLVPTTVVSLRQLFSVAAHHFLFVSSAWREIHRSEFVNRE